MMKKRSGFTLTELLVVLAVIAALAGISYPIARSAIAKSREAACLTRLGGLGIALESYLQDHNRFLPSMAIGRASKNEDVPVLDTVLLPYVENPEAFRCPADQAVFGKTGCSYGWTSMLSGEPVSQLSLFGITDRPDKIPLIFDKEAWHPGGANLLYADLSSSNKIRFVPAK